MYGAVELLDGLSQSTGKDWFPQLAHYSEAHVATEVDPQEFMGPWAH